MLEYLAGLVASIGAGLSMMSVHQVEPTHCSRYAEFDYCYYAGTPGNTKLVYFMPGFGNDVYGWTVNYTTGKIEQAWAATGASRPNVVTVSKGPWWYTERKEGFALNDFVNWFEVNELGFRPTERTLYGESMGGHNAVRWAADFPQVFSKLALNCPAFPRSFVKNVQGPSEGNPAYEFMAEQLIQGSYARSSQPKFNPLDPLPVGMEMNVVPKMYATITTKDDFGFFAGDMAFIHMQEANLNTKISYDVQSVRHCDTDGAQLAAFLQ